MEWAETRDIRTGGYLTHPTMIKHKDGEWERGIEADYGSESFPLDPRFFKEDVYDVMEIDVEQTKSLSECLERIRLVPKFGVNDRIIFASELETELKKDVVVMTPSDYIEETHKYFIRKVIPGKYIDKSPYPNFKRTYSPFWEIDPTLIQKDWRMAGIKHLRHWQKYFQHYHSYSNYSGLTSAKGLEKHITQFVKNKEGENWIEYCRSEKGYDFAQFGGNNYEEMAIYINKRRLRKARLFLVETIERLQS